MVMLSVFMTPMHKTQTHPLGDQFGLPLNYTLQQPKRAVGVRIMTRQSIGDQRFKGFGVLPRGKILEGTNPYVT